MRKMTIVLGTMLVAGCATQHPAWPPRWQLMSPADAGETNAPVYIWHEAKYQEDGNTYNIQFMAITNTTHVDPDSPYVGDIQSNRWPVVRTHIDLSLDGGATWPRRIGYGIKRDPGGVGATFVWSPPLDWTLLTTNAVLRATDLAGQPFAARDPAMPYDVPAGHYVTSAAFTIAGIQCLSPTNGQIVFANEPYTVHWRQAGAGDRIRLHWITQTTVSRYTNQVITVLSNCVEMATNTATVTMPAAVGESKLLFISESDPALHGYSGVISIE